MSAIGGRRSAVDETSGTSSVRGCHRRRARVCAI